MYISHSKYNIKTDITDNTDNILPNLFQFFCVQIISGG